VIKVDGNKAATNEQLIDKIQENQDEDDNYNKDRSSIETLCVFWECIKSSMCILLKVNFLVIFQVVSLYYNTQTSRLRN